MASPFLDSIGAAAGTVLPRLKGAQLPWLATLRQSALDLLLREGLPTTRDEWWKYTALRALERKTFSAHDSDAAMRDVAAALDVLAAHAGPRLVFVNGAFRADLSQLSELAEGLELMPLAQAIEEHPEPLRFALARGQDSVRDAFVRMNTAFADDGVFLRVAAGAKIDQPVHVVHIGAAADAPLAWHARNVIEIGAGASLTLVEQQLAADENANLATVVGDVVLRRGASFDAVILQASSEASVLMRRDLMSLDEDARARVHVLELGGALVRHELGAELRGDRARLETRGAFMPHARQHMDIMLDIRHAARDTSSDAMWRGVADDRGRAAFHGRIVVDPGADGTDANLDNKNLMISPHAEIDTRPVLEIHADEVKAAHGATVGQLDEHALFYLRSRGIPLDAARRMLMLAFVHAVLAGVDDRSVRDAAQAALAARGMDD